MTSLADLQQWREALRKARISGVRSVADANGERVDYRSDREMEAALKYCDQLIAEAQGGRQPNTIKFDARKGV